MATGTITTGFTLMWNDVVYYSGSPFDTWLGYDSGMQGYLPGTGAVGFQLPAASSFLPAGQGLASLTFSGPAGHDGNGWNVYSVIEGGFGSVANPGPPGDLTVTWTPAKALTPAQVDAYAVRVRDQWVYGGVANTFGRFGHASTAAGQGWYGPWTLTWTSSLLPSNSQMLL